VRRALGARMKHPNQKQLKKYFSFSRAYRIFSTACLAKMSGRMNSLYLGASFAPRMLQAESQIQDSSDLPFEFIRG
jgi:hypothetical protein